MQFVYSSSVLEPKKPDELFQDEARALRAAGHAISVIDVEALENGKTRILPALQSQANVIYRGWMLKPATYANWIASLAEADSTPLTDETAYRAAHYLPEWYSLLADYTPATVVLALDDELEGNLRQIGWSRFFIKDYVKSLKTSVGSFIDKPEQIHTVIAEMNKFRGEIEGGLCIRQVEDFLPATEQRYFVIHRTPYASQSETAIPTCVAVAAERIQSPFFSVDVVQRADGLERIVEIGDGQVSDLSGWTVERFAEIWPSVS